MKSVCIIRRFAEIDNDNDMGSVRWSHYDSMVCTPSRRGTRVLTRKRGPIDVDMMTALSKLSKFPLSSLHQGTTRSSCQNAKIAGGLYHTSLPRFTQFTNRGAHARPTKEPSQSESSPSVLVFPIEKLDIQKFQRPSQNLT